MEKKKRSSLRKPLIGNSPTTSQKQSSRRRISFNSKKSIREFRQEEMIILEDYEVSDINSETGASPKSNQKIIKTKTTLILEESKPTVDDNISIPSIRGSLESVNKSMPTFSNFECTADITLLNSEQHLQKKSKEMPLNSKMEVMVHENDTTLWSSSSYENNKKIHVNVWESSDALLNSIPRDHQQNRHMQEAIEENPFEETPTASGNLLEEIHRIYKRDLSDTPPSDGIQKLLASIKNEELKEISSNQIESINKVKLSQQSEMFAYRALSSELNESLKSLTKQSLTVPTEIVTKTKTNCKSDEPNKLRFSQADETLLENTTFLAQVKLGDETIDFGNISSKRSLAGSQRISEDTDLSCETLSTGDIAKKKAEKNTIIFSVNKDNLHLKQNFKGLSNVNILPSLDCNMEYESGLEMKCQPAKVRKTIILHENIQDEEATVPRVLSQASDVPTDNKHSELAIKIYNKNCTRSRKTKILNKSINDTEDAQAERAKTRKKYSTSSQTMMLNESIKIDDSTLPIESLPFRKTATTTEATTKQCEIIDQNEEYAKSRRTLMLHESIEADKTGSFSVYSHGAIHKDKCEKGKYARGSLRRIEPMDVQTEDIINKNSLQQTKNKLQNESYTTLSKSFAFECKVLDEIPFTRDEQLVTSKRNKEYAKIRKTMILHEDIVEEMKADQLGSLRESSSKNENINADVVAGGEHAEKIGTTKKVAKHRQTIVFNDNIEDDVTIVPTKNLPGAISKDKNISETYEQSNYHVKGNQSTTLNKNKKADTAVKCKITDENIKREKNCIKGRQTIVFNENIEMDATTVSSGSMPSKNKLTAEECLSSYVQSDITERDKTYAQSRRENLECGIEDVASKYSQRAITKGICKKEKRNHLDKSIYEIEPMDIEMECSTNKISPKQNEIEYSTLSKTFASKYKASDDLRSTNEEQPKGNVKIRKTLILNEDIVEDVKADSMQSLFGSFFKSENITREVCTSSEKSKKTDYDKSVAREGQTVMQHDSTENYKRQISARSLCGMIFKDEVKSETCLHSDKQLGKVQGEINSVKNRQTMILNEIIEDDITKEFPDRTCSVASKDKTNYEQQSGIGQCKKKFRGKQTMMLNENIEKELTTGPTGLQSSTSKYKIAEQGDVYLKGRNVTISNESMLEEPKAELPKGPYSLTSKYQSTEQDNVNVKERKTLILNENIENDPTLSSNAAYKYKIINEVLVSNEEQPATINQHQQRSKIRKTMILHEDIEDEMKAVQLGSLNQPCFKNEKISEDTFANSDQFENAGNDANLVEAGQTMILHENDKVNAIEAARSLHGTTFKDKTTSQMCVLSHEQVGRFLGENSHVKGKQKMMLSEIVEVDKENDFSNCRRGTISTDKPISEDHFPSDEQYGIMKQQKKYIKGRQTMIYNETIEDDEKVVPLNRMRILKTNVTTRINDQQLERIEQSSKKNVKGKKSTVFNENIEKNITESLHGDTSTDKCANEIHRPRCKQTKVINRDKKKYFTRRQTEILHDNIEEDTMGKYGDISKEKAEPLAKKSRESIYSVESMDIEMECTSFKTPSQELKDKLTNQLYSTPSKTCANQERLRRMYAMTPRRSLLEFTRLERTILKECNTTHVEFASMNNESQTFKIKSLKDNFNMDMSGLELNDSNITDWRSAKKLSSTQTQSLAELSRDTVNLRMSTLFNEAFGNLSKSNNLSIQDVRRQKTLCFNSVTDINLDNLNDIQDTSITKSNISKYFINHTQLSTPNFSNNLALPQLQYTDNGRLSDEEPIPLASTIKDSNNADDTEFLNEIQITLVDNHERCDKESSCKLFSGSNCNNATYTKICRKCQQCQRPLTSNDNNDDTCSSPIITNLPPISLKISPLDDIYKKLDALQKRTRLRDIDNLWYQMSLNNMKNKANLSELQLEIDKIGKVDDVPRMWMKYKDEMAQFEKKVAQKYEKTKPSIPVVDQLENLLGVSNLSQWFFDHDFEMSGIYIFTNRLSSTFKLKILFDAICPLGTKIRINKIQYGHRIEQNIWKPIDFILDVQLRLKHQEGMLLSLCEGHEAADIYDMLQTLQQSIESVLKLGNELQRIVIKHNALLKRDGLYRYFLHKVVRRIVPSPETYDRVEKIEFEINILNIRDVNYRNIVKPRLHNFQEMIQLLPVGLDFLNVFLVDPLKFLKPDLIDSLFN